MSSSAERAAYIYYTYPTCLAVFLQILIKIYGVNEYIRVNLLDELHELEHAWGSVRVAKAVPQH